MAPTSLTGFFPLNNFTIYEFPLNERIRLFMRLEQLFQQVDHFVAGASVWDSRAVISTLLDVLSLFSRNDLKSEALKELDRHSAALTKMTRTQPDIDHGKVETLLARLDALSKELYGNPGKIGVSLMENDLFKSISQRSAIPGGTCSFDLPAFHYWLQLGDTQRRRDLAEWILPFQPIRTAIDLLLSFIRGCGTPGEELAAAGFFQKTLDHTLPYQLLRVAVERDQPYFAEISGGKHRFTVRFMRPDAAGRPVQCPEDVRFQLTCCLL
ncbi:cell division protein ZapD [Methylomagnum ishizawai]|nr:cell division protein ZapD [Methylomagnum ishizawai]